MQPCGEQRLHHQMLCHGPARGAADQLAAEKNFQAGEIQPALVGRDVRDIAPPGLLWRGCGEILVQQVRCHWQVVLRIGHRLELAILPATQSKFFTQPLCDELRATIVEPLKRRSKVRKNEHSRSINSTRLDLGTTRLISSRNSRLCALC